MKLCRYIIIAIFPLLTYCAHNSPKKSETKQFSQQKVDKVYVRTQADYHFLKGELLGRTDPEASIKEFKEALIYDQKSTDLRLRLAGEYLRNGLISEAVDQAEEAKKIDPTNKEARLVLAGLYTSTKMHNKALAEYNYLANKNFHKDDVLTYRAVLHAEMGNADKAVSEFRKLTKTSEDPGKAYYYLARVYLEFHDGKEQQAINAFKKSIALNPSNIQAVTDLVRIYQAQKKEKLARQILENHYETYGSSLEGSKMLSQMYLSENNFDKAIEHLEVVERRDPTNQNNILKLALSLIETKNYTSAIIKLESLLEQNPGNEKLLFYLGSVNEETGADTIAKTYFDQIKRGSSLYAQAFLHRTYIAKRTSGVDDAIALINEELVANPSLQMSFMKASFLDENNRTQEALDYVKTLKGEEVNLQLVYLEGSLLDKLGNKQEASVIFREILAVNQNHVQSLNHLAYMYAESGTNLNEAEKLAFRANNLKPKDPHILDTIGYIHLLQGKAQSAVRYLEIAHEIMPTESIIAEHLGDAYNKLRKIDKAKALYLKAAGLAQDEKTASLLKNKIDKINSVNRLPAAVAKP